MPENIAETVKKAVEELEAERLEGTVIARADFKKERRAYRNLKNRTAGAYRLQCPVCLKTGFHKMDCPEANK
jgi:hypothetical protein